MSRSYREWVEANDPTCPLPMVAHPSLVEVVAPAPLFSVNATCLLSMWLRQSARQHTVLARALWHFFCLPMPAEEVAPW